MKYVKKRFLKDVFDFKYRLFKNTTYKNILFKMIENTYLST